MSSFGLNDIGLGYTIATGKLYCDFQRFHEFAEHLLRRPVYTHEFAERHIYVELRQALESLLLEDA